MSSPLEITLLGGRYSVILISITPVPSTISSHWKEERKGGRKEGGRKGRREGERKQDIEQLERKIIHLKREEYLDVALVLFMIKDGRTFQKEDF